MVSAVWDWVGCNRTWVRYTRKMSNCDIQVDNEKNTTIFQSPFPVPEENGKIKTWEFLNASKGLVSLLEKFGKVFKAVKTDMNGNIFKLTDKYNTDKDSYVYLDDMVLSEKGTSVIIATDALLWLGRALHFVQRFFELFIEDSKNGSNELVPILKTAYVETLKQHHGWVTQQLFRLIVRMCPTRSQLIKNMAPSQDSSVEEVLTNMSEFAAKLKENVVIIKAFYEEHDLESGIKM